MDFELYFCADGILRARWSEKKPLMPLEFIQKESQYAQNDLGFWSKWWDQNTQFEEGLTIASFLECLKPWSQFFSDLTGKDVSAYITESKKPTLIENNTHISNIDWIGLSYNIHISPKTKHKKENFDLNNINDWLNKPKDTKLTGFFDINETYSLSGYKMGFEEHYGVDHIPINKIANLPFYLNQNKKILIFDSVTNLILSEDKQLLNKDGFGIRSLKDKNGNTAFNYISGEKHYVLREIVERFFENFATNPEKRDDFNDYLREVMTQHHERNKQEPLKEEKTNVIDFKTKKEKKINELSEQIIDVKKKKSKLVKIEETAFSPLIESMKNTEEYWDKIIKAAGNSVVMRVGRIKTAHNPENRMSGSIVEEEDLSTDFKKI